MIEDVGLGLRLARAGRPLILDPELQCTHLKEWTWGGFLRTDYRHRAMPWTRMMRDNRDLAHVLNAGARGKAAVVAVAASLVALPLLPVAPVAGALLLLAALGALGGPRAAVPGARGASRRRGRGGGGLRRPLGALPRRGGRLRAGAPGLVLTGGFEAAGDLRRRGLGSPRPSRGVRAAYPSQRPRRRCGSGCRRRPWRGRT